MQEKETISLEVENLLKKGVVEQVCPQKDQFLRTENSLVKKRVHVQTRPQGRIFICPTFSGRPKESDVSMGRNPVPVSMPVLWPWTSPICFHKIPKDPNGPFKKDRDTHSNLF